MKQEIQKDEEILGKQSPTEMNFLGKTKNTLLKGALFGAVAGLVGILTAIIVANYFGLGSNSNDMTGRVIQIEAEIIDLRQNLTALENDSLNQTLSDQFKNLEMRMNTLREELTGLNSSTASQLLGVTEISQNVSKLEENLLSMQDRFMLLERNTNQAVSELKNSLPNNSSKEIAEANQTSPGLGSLLPLPNYKPPTSSNATEEFSQDNRLFNLQTEVEELDQQLITLQENWNQEIDLVLQTLTLTGVRFALDVGAPYKKLIDSVGGLEQILPTSLLDHATEGVQTSEELVLRLESLEFQAIEADQTNGNNESDQSSVMKVFSSMVQVKRLTETEGDDTRSILSQMKARLVESHLDSVLNLFSQLKPEVQNVLSEWIDDVKARNEAINSLDAILANLASQA